MTPTKLLTRTGEYVVTVQAPPMSPEPEIIAWGSRLFVRRENGEYREGMVWVAASPVPVFGGGVIERQGDTDGA